ncbi:MAG: methyltransferase domain-containing protein [Xanthobacteraceae bacterium]
MAPGGRLAELFAATVIQHQTGAIAEAERNYRRIIALSPDFADAHSRLGGLLMTQGNATDAIRHIERALALRPDMFEALGNLTQAYMFVGQPERAIGPALRVLELSETPQTRTLFAHCLGVAHVTKDDGRIRGLALRALSEGWGRPRTLTGACVSLIKLNPIVADWIARSNAAWPGRLSPDELLASPLPAALATDRLLIHLLECDPVTDIGLERLVTNMRHALLHNASSQAASDDKAGPLLDFACALASQCFINEYVFSQTESETAAALQLRALLEAALTAPASAPSLWPSIAGAYWPLHKLANAQSLLKRQWPPAVEALIAQQVKEPARERELASTIPALTEIDDEVSRLVRQQYEENPYPRWAGAGTTERAAIPPTEGPKQSRDVLIAGCGTALGAIEFAREARQVRILAVDLSLASLSYAKRMAQTLGVTNIEFAQADINKLGSIGRTFDFIDVSGVLHHLADPWRGWRVLLSLLRPGGTMQVCLYSALARQNVVAGRALIAERSYRPIPEDIRHCREAIMAADDASPLKSLARADDFFSTSEFRDMLFHVQEHRITLPEIRSFLAENKLEFAGFNLDQAALRQFSARFPGPSALLNLDCWHRYEVEAPSTFLGMYQFWVRKPAA